MYTFDTYVCGLCRNPYKVYYIVHSMSYASIDNIFLRNRGSGRSFLKRMTELSVSLLQLSSVVGVVPLFLVFIFFSLVV